MKVLYLDSFSSYPLARAGGHRSGHGLLYRMAQQSGVECMALMPKRGRGAQFPSYDPKVSDFEALGIRQFRLEGGRWHFDCGYPIVAVDDVAAVAAEAVESFGADLIYCQSPEVRPFLELARARGSAAIWYIRDTRPRAEDLLAADAMGVQLVALSRFAADRIRELCGVEAEVVHSLIEEEHYRVTPDPDGAVTLINPIADKGYEIFLELVPLLPEVRFLAVEAWPLGPDLEKVERQLAAFPNVRFLHQQADAREVYRRTRLLLVPSIIEEGGPRVVREAHLSGIPAIGSRRGAIREHLGDGGLIVEDDENPRAWAAAVRGLLADPERLRQVSRAAWRNARRREFTTDYIVRRFLQICRRTLSARAARESGKGGRA